MKFIKNIKREFKKSNLSEKSIALGFIFGVMFWVVFDSIGLGIGLGIAMMIAFNEEEKRKSKNKNK